MQLKRKFHSTNLSKRSPLGFVLLRYFLKHEHVHVFGNDITAVTQLYGSVINSWL